MKSTTILAVLAAAVDPITVSAQGPCDLRVYDACRDAANIFMESTCNPLNQPPNLGKTVQNSTVTLFDACKCYQASQVVLCYQQCSSNNTLQAELNGGAIPSQTAICNAAQLNPARLPTPPPWQTFFASTTTSSVKATGTGTASASGSPTGTSAGQGGSSGAIAATEVDAGKIVAMGGLALVGVVALLL